MDNICIVLVEPQGPINVGSVCRCMMNFGCSDLRLVNPCSGYRSLDARRMALKAESILQHAPVFQTLQQALADCHLAFGTTRRFALPLLQHFDALGKLVREGDHRRLRT